MLKALTRSAAAYGSGLLCGSCPGPNARRELSSPGWASRFPSKRRERRCVLLDWPTARSTRSSWRVAPSWSGRTRRRGTAATRFDYERRPLLWAWIRGGSQRCLTSSIVRSGLAGRTGLVQELIRETMCGGVNRMLPAHGTQHSRRTSHVTAPTRNEKTESEATVSRISTARSSKQPVLPLLSSVVCVNPRVCDRPCSTHAKTERERVRERAVCGARARCVRGLR